MFIIAGGIILAVIIITLARWLWPVIPFLVLAVLAGHLLNNAGAQTPPVTDDCFRVRATGAWVRLEGPRGVTMPCLPSDKAAGRTPEEAATLNAETIAKAPAPFRIVGEARIMSDRDGKRWSCSPFIAEGGNYRDAPAYYARVDHEVVLEPGHFVCLAYPQ